MPSTKATPMETVAIGEATDLGVAMRVGTDPRAGTDRTAVRRLVAVPGAARRCVGRIGARSGIGGGGRISQDAVLSRDGRGKSRVFRCLKWT